MALDKMPGAAGLNPMQPLEALKKGPQDNGLSQGADSVEFKRALEQAGLQFPQAPGAVVPTPKVQPTAGADALGALAKAQMPGQAGAVSALANAQAAGQVAGQVMGQSPALKFSNHAIERMHSRGISFQPEEMRNIQNAITKAAGKGSKDTLVISGDNALIVSVKNNTVVTVMDKAAMKDNVFTNIDSTVVI